MRLSPNLCNLLKIFADLSKLLPVFLLGTESVMGGVDSGSGLCSNLWLNKKSGGVEVVDG